MRGSEKQIVWANELKATVVKVLNDAVKMQKAVAPQLVENIKGFEALRDAVESFDGYAGDVIGMFGDYKARWLTGDISKDTWHLLDIIRISRLSPSTGW